MRQGVAEAVLANSASHAVGSFAVLNFLCCARLNIHISISHHILLIGLRSGLALRLEGASVRGVSVSAVMGAPVGVARASSESESSPLQWHHGGTIYLCRQRTL